MLPQHRPSILWRPRGQPSQCNVESAETEYQRYQARLAALQERTAVNESRLLSKLYPPGKQNHTRHNMSQQGQEVQGMDARTGEMEQQPARYGEQHMEHPWCLQAKDADAAMREAIRRKESRATMRQNMEMADKKKRTAELERARERSMDCSTVTSEKQWWNYGASSETWIPPEHRVRGRGSKTPYAETLHSCSGDILQWHDDTPRSSSQASAVSCNHTAPYATSENAPALRRTEYRPKAPYHTEQNGGPNLTDQSQRAPSDSSRASSLRPPFSLHNESSTTMTAAARPHRRDSRPQSALSNAAPFDRDDQPAPPPRRSIFRTCYRGGVQCPFDREDAMVAPRPRQRTVTYPYATSEHPLPQGNRVAARTSDGGSMSKYSSEAGGENEGAVNNRTHSGRHAAGKPSPPKHPKESLEPGGGRASPESAKYANEATTVEVPMTYPFVATASGIVPEQPQRPGPHTPEAPRRMSRGTPESMARRQAMQRGAGVDAALHAYGGEGRASASPVNESALGNDDGADEGCVSAASRPIVDALVAKHVRGSSVYAGQPYQSSTASAAVGRREGSSMHDVPFADDRSARPPYAVVRDQGSRRDAAYRQSYGNGNAGSGRASGGVSRGQTFVQPEWMHTERPAGKPTGREGLRERQLQASRESSGRDGLPPRDQVAQIMQHSEASLRSAPGGEMFGMIDKLSKKYGAQTLQ